MTDPFVLDLRPVTADDEHDLWDLHKATMRGLVDQVWGWDEAVQREFFRAYLDAGNLSIIVVDGEAVGAVQVHTADDHYLLSQIEVAPAHQGQGYGTRVIRRLQEQATQDGRSIQLQVLKVNPAALRLYERLGFHRTGETDTHRHLTWSSVSLPGTDPAASATE